MKNKNARTLSGLLSQKSYKKKVSTETKENGKIQKITLRRYPKPLIEEFLFKITPQLLQKMRSLDKVIVYFNGWHKVKPGYYELVTYDNDVCSINTPIASNLEVSTQAIFLTQELYSLYNKGLPFVYKEEKTPEGDENLILEVLKEERISKLDINRLELPD